METTETIFWDIVAASLAGADRNAAEMERELHRLEAERIASAAFCGVGIDPAVLGFATVRAARHLGLTEEQMDLAIAAALLQTAGRLAADLAARGRVADVGSEEI